MAIDVFVSVGKPGTEKQARFTDSIENLLKLGGMEPKHGGRSSVAPLKKINESIGPCSGAVIIAFERLYAKKALELRGGDKEKSHDPYKIPTVWNQIEAAMAYSAGFPLLIVAETGLAKEGVLEQYDWTVQWIDIDEAEIDDPEFQEIFKDWSERVRRFDTSKDSANDQDEKDDIGNRTFYDLAKEIRIEHAKPLIGMISGYTTAVFALGVFIAKVL
jgi:hypothetical protein